MLSSAQESVEITDVTARDGFQMEKEWISTEDKLTIINDILSSGIKRIEATSFVSPKAVPQLKDAKEILDHMNRINNVSIAVLVPNIKGAELALQSQIDEINVVISISESHNQNNIRRTVNQSISEIGEISQLAHGEKKKVNIGLATTFGCPFEGKISIQRLIKVVEALIPYGVHTFSLSDTIGVANPRQVFETVTIMQGLFPEETFSLHLHNTRGMGLANLLAGYQAGITKFDASLGGIGGCPFAPGATGNVCTEDIVHMFTEMGVETAIDLGQLLLTSKKLEKILGYTLPGQIMKLKSPL